VARFALAKHEVTRAEFEEFVREARYVVQQNGCMIWDEQKSIERPDSTLSWQMPGFAQGPDHPVICVSWHDAKAYVAWLNKKKNLGFRLPTEAEWEYAARSGAYRSDGRLLAGRYRSDADPRTQRSGTSAVGAFAANAFGLHDMHGNVWEWVEDCWSGDYSARPKSDGAQAWMTENCGARVVRGAGWQNNRRDIRSSLRWAWMSESRSNDLGFRVARSIE
jgi:formylglycine-generating enzyme required for sulfatase activity